MYTRGYKKERKFIMQMEKDDAKQGGDAMVGGSQELKRARPGQRWLEEPGRGLMCYAA